MDYEDRHSLEMRWFEGDVLAAQEHLTEMADLDGDGVAGEMQTISWTEFQKVYADTKSDHGGSPGLYKLFEWYEIEFQRIIYRRFKYLYSTRWSEHVNPQQVEHVEAEGPHTFDGSTMERWQEEEKLIEKEQKDTPDAGLVIPDHRCRRIQHLLSDLVLTLDEVSRMNFNRPIRRCTMGIDGIGGRIPCDCNFVDCNPKGLDFKHRQLDVVGAESVYKSPLMRSSTWSSALRGKQNVPLKYEHPY